MGKGAHKRKQDIVFLNILFCLLVIYIHISSEVITDMPRNTQLFAVAFSAQKLSSFVVQGFLLLSGVKFFLHKGDGINFPKYYASRFVRIVLPYVFWVAVYYAYFCGASGKSFNVNSLLGHILSGDMWAHFYFVIILIQFEVLAPLWILMFKKGNAAVHMAFSTVITAICAQYLPAVLTTLFPSMPDFNVSSCFLRYQIYWTAGCLIGKYYDEFCSYLKSNKIMICLTFVLCGAVYVSLSLVTVGHEPVWMELFNILYSMSAILFFYMLAQLFTIGRGKLLRIFAPFDKSAYMVYLAHCLMIAMLNNYLTSINISDIPRRFGIRAAVVYGGCFLLSYIWQLIKNMVGKALSKREN